MVSSCSVSNDVGSLEDLISNYSNSVESLNGSWQGDSYDNFVAQTSKFVSKIDSVKGRLSNFSRACSLYEDFEQKYSSYQNAVSNYNNASSDLSSSDRNNLLATVDSTKSIAQKAAKAAYDMFSNIK